MIHQLTDLPQGLDPSEMAEGTKRNARMRSEETQSLVSAALASGVRRLIVQSIAWMCATPGPQPHPEDDPLDIDARGTRAITVAGVVTLERLALLSLPEGIVLRYGHLYGPAAAAAALLAIQKARKGIFNIAEPSAYLSVEKARRELGFDPSFRMDD